MPTALPTATPTLVPEKPQQCQDVVLSTRETASGVLEVVTIRHWVYGNAILNVGEQPSMSLSEWAYAAVENGDVYIAPIIPGAARTWVTTDNQTQSFEDQRSIDSDPVMASSEHVAFKRDGILYAFDGKGVFPLMNNEGHEMPVGSANMAWSRDHQRLLFTGSSGEELYLYDFAAIASPVRLLYTPAQGQVVEIDWARSEQIALTIRTEAPSGFHRHIEIIDMNGSLIEVIDLPGEQENPAWSDDSQTLAFASIDDTGFSRIMTRPLSWPQDVYAVYTEQDAAYQPSWWCNARLMYQAQHDPYQVTGVQGPMMSIFSSLWGHNIETVRYLDDGSQEISLWRSEPDWSYETYSTGIPGSIHFGVVNGGNNDADETIWIGWMASDRQATVSP